MLASPDTPFDTHLDWPWDLTQIPRLSTLPREFQRFTSLRSQAQELQVVSAVYDQEKNPDHPETVAHLRIRTQASEDLVKACVKLSLGKFSRTVEVLEQALFDATSLYSRFPAIVLESIELYLANEDLDPSRVEPLLVRDLDPQLLHAYESDENAVMTDGDVDW